MKLLFWVLISYLAGSFPTGYIAARLVKGVDIRTFGSGNVGATNVGRLMGKKWAVAVTLADMVKASIGIILARYFGTEDPFILSLAAFSGVCGHNFPVWLGFRGGKGGASSYGVVFFMNPPLSFLLAPAGGLVWIMLLKLKGYVSLASLISLWALPVFAAALRFPLPYILLTASLAALSTLRHRENIRRLFEGKESSFKKQH